MKNFLPTITLALVGLGTTLAPQDPVPLRLVDVETETQKELQALQERVFGLEVLLVQVHLKQTSENAGRLEAEYHRYRILQRVCLLEGNAEDAQWFGERADQVYEEWKGTPLRMDHISRKVRKNIDDQEHFNELHHRVLDHFFTEQQLGRILKEGASQWRKQVELLDQ